MGKKLKYKDINLLAAQDRKRKVVKENKASVVRLPILVLFLVLLLLGITYRDLYQKLGNLEEKKRLLELNLNDPAWIADYHESLRLGNESQLMSEQKEELELTVLHLSSYPDIFGDDFQLIYDTAGDSIILSGVSYNRKNGVLSFEAECATVTGVPIFVAQLRLSPIFSDIKYEGYTERAITTTLEGSTSRVWIPQLGPDNEPQLDANGNEIGYWQEDKSTFTKTNKSYVFSVTALVKAPEPRMPGPGESLYGSEDEGENDEDSEDAGAAAGNSGSGNGAGQ